MIKVVILSASEKQEGLLKDLVHFLFLECEVLVLSEDAETLFQLKQAIRDMPDNER